MRTSHRSLAHAVWKHGRTHQFLACRGAVTRRTSELITLVLLPLSILMVCYALFVYHFRSKFLKKKQVRAPEESCSTDYCIEPYLQHRSASCRTCPATTATVGLPHMQCEGFSARSAELALRTVLQHTGTVTSSSPG